ncbi:MAG: glycosyltransferase family 4 protein [Firmicutes bacterium]|nr:glycosyltransferase family 4 protein [Bacillota bacterium]
MYVMFVARGYPTEKYKLNGIFEFDQAKALAALGCKVVYAVIDVRSARRWRKWGYEFKKKDNVYIHAINIPWGPIGGQMRRKVGTLGANWLYDKICTIHGTPDILHGHFTGSAYIALKLSERTGVPLVVTEHSSKINEPNIEPGLFQRAREAYSKAKAVIAVSPTLAKRIDEHFGIQAIYIPNIVDVDIFKHKRKNGVSDNFGIISTGNLIKTKRMDLTIAAFAQTFKTDPTATLTIFGDGPERRGLEQQISGLGMSDRIRLAGLRPRWEIADALSNSHCFVLASQTETFGVAYIEALASGVPVIATRCGGPEVFVTEENGILVDVDDINQLSSAMQYMFKHSNAYDREIIAYHTKKRFSPTAVAEQIRQLYREII